MHPSRYSMNGSAKCGAWVIYCPSLSVQDYVRSHQWKKSKIFVFLSFDASQNSLVRCTFLLYRRHFIEHKKERRKRKVFILYLSIKTNWKQAEPEFHVDHFVRALPKCSPCSESNENCVWRRVSSSSPSFFFISPHLNSIDNIFDCLIIFRMRSFCMCVNCISNDLTLEWISVYLSFLFSSPKYFVAKIMLRMTDKKCHFFTFLFIVAVVAQWHSERCHWTCSCALDDIVVQLKISIVSLQFRWNLKTVRNI